MRRISNLTIHLHHDIPQLLTLSCGKVLTISTDSGYPRMPQQSVLLRRLFWLSPIPFIELYKAEVMPYKAYTEDYSVHRENLDWPTMEWLLLIVLSL